MTNSEALEYMGNEIRCIQRSKICDRDCAKCTLVKEDKPLIEAYDIAISALEKQLPKRPIPNEKDNIRFSLCYSCPECGRTFSGTGIADYCYHCGQALDWSEE